MQNPERSVACTVMAPAGPLRTVMLPDPVTTSKSTGPLTVNVRSKLASSRASKRRLENRRIKERTMRAVLGYSLNNRS